MARSHGAWILVTTGAIATAIACKPTPQDRAKADAAADLAKGTAVIMTSSGVGRSPLTPDVDRETGLPFRDTGCVVDPAYDDAYNASVHAFIRDHGLPASSVKGRILDEATVDRAMRNGTDLFPGAPSREPDGRGIELRGDLLHVEGGVFAKPFERPLGLGPIDRVRFVWAPRGQVLVQVEGPSRESLVGGRVRVQIDPGCGCVLQVLH
jgi:hypothetical protein